MDYFELLYNIRNSYRNCQYLDTLNYIEMYLSDKNNMVFDLLISNYVEVLIKLRKFDEAYNTIKKTIKIWPYLYSIPTLIEKYIVCGQFDDAENLLKDNLKNDHICYRAACTYMLYEQYGLAKKYFTYCIENSKNEMYKAKSKEAINKIDNYIYKGAFIPILYKKFKLNGNKLYPGLILYAREVESVDCSSYDYHKSSIPYMVYKVDGEKIYTFPISKVKENHKPYIYILEKKNYINYEFDRHVKDNMAIILEKNIEKIVDEVSHDDYIQALNSVYVSYCIGKRKDTLGANFFNDTRNDIKIKNGSIFVDCTNKVQMYYVVMTTEDGYLCLKVQKQESFYLETELVHIPKDTEYIYKPYLSAETVSTIAEEANKVLIKK